jgi:arabinogalactan oligomer / maltooligosaccharide transport system permease protein
MAMMAAKPPQGRQPAAGFMGVGSSKPPEGVWGAAFAITLVLALCALALLIGQTVLSLVVAASPTSPLWLLLVFVVVALIPLLLIAVRVFPWLANWYYLLPAIICLLTFTVYPIVLTFGYAFTNFNSQNNNRPDSTTEISVARASENSLRLTGDSVVSTLACRNEGCVGEPLELRTDAEIGRPGPTFLAQRIEGNTIVFDRPVPEDTTRVRRINPISNIGFGNFRDIFSKASVQLTPVLIWTVIFAISTTVLNVIVGLLLGILLNNKRLKFRNLYRSLLILPWAVPGVISIQMWAVLMNQNFGGLNRLLGLFGALPVPWLTDPLWAKVAVLVVNLWLGFPYMMTATLGALSAIPDELYEAAEVDGATKLEQVRFITLPMLTVAFTPIVLATFAFNFNNFGIIYLLTGGGPAEVGREATARSTDILLSWGFNTAFTGAGAQAYGLAGAVSVIVGVLTVVISFFNFRVAGVFKEARR